MKIYLEYKRLSKMVDGDYPHTGKFKHPDGTEEPFIGWHFKRLIGRISEVLNQYPDVDEILLQRTDREGIPPMLMGSQLIGLIRRDPLTAYRTMNFNTQSFRTENRTAHAALSKEFGPTVYVKVESGRAQCPITGEFKPLAYGSKQGWKIRGEGNSHSKWVPLLQIFDDSPRGTLGIERLAFCHWAQVNVQALLDLGHPRYFLPRDWNKKGPWISREDLERMLKEYGEGTQWQAQ